jgi:hypothetical protein
MEASRKGAPISADQLVATRSAIHLRSIDSSVGKMIK